ncbi:hypothetical protein KCU71_g719, partial [Aureobasidium melanogenum]
MDPNPDTPAAQPSPGLFRYVLGFLLVGAAWGLTTPFMRRAAVSSSSSSTPESRAWLEHPNAPWLKAKVWGVLYGVWDVLRNPAYAIPFLINVTGSVWFFLLIGQAELSLTVPITNSLAFLFTVLGEWWAEKKVITKAHLQALYASAQAAVKDGRTGVVTKFKRVKRAYSKAMQELTVREPFGGQSVTFADYLFAVDKDDVDDGAIEDHPPPDPDVTATAAELLDKHTQSGYEKLSQCIHAALKLPSEDMRTLAERACISYHTSPVYRHEDVTLHLPDRTRLCILL